MNLAKTGSILSRKRKRQAVAYRRFLRRKVDGSTHILAVSCLGCCERSDSSDRFINAASCVFHHRKIWTAVTATREPACLIQSNENLIAAQRTKCPGRVVTCELRIASADQFLIFHPLVQSFFGFSY